MEYHRSKKYRGMRTTESGQIVVIFCVSIIAIIGIVSVVVCYSKDQINFKLNARHRQPDESETELGIELSKKDEKESR
jgi:uncharacterized metal-binding protein